MNSTTIIDSHGEIVKVMSGKLETIITNTPPGCFRVEGSPPSRTSYYKNGQWFNRPEKVSEVETWDIIAKRWNDSRTLSEMKQQRWNQVKELASKKENANITINGFEFQADPDSVFAVLRTMQIGVLEEEAGAVFTVKWTLANNTLLELNLTQLKTLVKALGTRQSNIRERANELRALISNSNTKEELEALRW